MLTLIFSLFAASSSYGSYAIDKSQDDALVSCTTSGVEAFARHSGGYRFRLGPVQDSQRFVRAHFWQVSPIQADALITSDLGFELMNVVPVSRGGLCELRLNQVNDRDGNEMDIRIQINSIDPEQSRGVVAMKLNGLPIRADHGRLGCRFKPAYASQTLRACAAQAYDPSGGPFNAR